MGNTHTHTRAHRPHRHANVDASSLGADALRVLLAARSKVTAIPAATITAVERASPEPEIYPAHLPTPLSPIISSLICMSNACVAKGCDRPADERARAARGVSRRTRPQGTEKRPEAERRPFYSGGDAADSSSRGTELQDQSTHTYLRLSSHDALLRASARCGGCASSRANLQAFLHVSILF